MNRKLKEIEHDNIYTASKIPTKNMQKKEISRK